VEAPENSDWHEERTALQAIYEQDVAFPSASCTVLQVTADGGRDEVRLSTMPTSKGPFHPRSAVITPTPLAIPRRNMCSVLRSSCWSSASSLGCHTPVRLHSLASGVLLLYIRGICGRLELPQVTTVLCFRS